MESLDGVFRFKKHIRVTNRHEAAGLLRVHSTHDREQLIVIHLTPLLDAFAKQIPAMGTMTSVGFEMHDVFRKAVLLDTKAIIVAHNHPYENKLIRSNEDVELTEKLVEAGKALRIYVLDHIILGPKQYLSLRANGIGGFGKSADYRESLGEFGATFIRARHKVSNTFVCRKPKRRKK